MTARARPGPPRKTGNSRTALSGSGQTDPPDNGQTFPPAPAPPSGELPSASSLPVRAPVTPEPAIVIDGLHKSFPGGKAPALRDISSRVWFGKITGLVGPDGAGKSTLIRLLVGLLAADSGSARVAGFDAATEAGRIHPLIGYMPQKFGLYEELSVIENLRLYADLRSVAGPEKQSRFDRLLRFTGLEPFQSRLAGRLSGGMKQKLGLACALTGDPRILLLDEPSVGVDPISRRELWKMVRQLLSEGTAVVWSTSYLDEAEQCDAVMLLNEGRLLYDGPPAGLLERVRGRVWRLGGLAPDKRRRKLMRLLCNPNVTDAVLQGRSLRLVAAPDAAPPGLWPDADPDAVSPGLGSDVGAGEEHGGPETDKRAEQNGREVMPPAAEAPPRTPPGEMISPGPPPFALLSLASPPFALRSESCGSGGSSGEGQAGSVWTAAEPRFEDAFIDVLGGGPGGVSAIGERIAEKPRTNAPVIDANGLTKQFGSFTAVRDNTFQIRQGEIFGLLGPNGAGKSTTFKMMCGLLQPSAGTASIMGLDLRRSSSQARGRIGYMAQKFSLYGGISVLQNLRFFSGVYGLSGKARQDRVDLMISLFGLENFLRMNADSLPLGFKQRLALACAVMHEPDILFLDEPTSGVDPVTRREFWLHINAMVQKGVTVMVTTHFMDEAEYCDRIALIYRGENIATGAPDDLKNLIRTPERPDPTLEDAFIALVEQSDTKEHSPS